MRIAKIKNPVVLALLQKKMKRIRKLKEKHKEYWGW